MLKLLIVEEALKNKSGHWYEYNRAIVEEARDQGFEVTILAHQDLESDIQSELGATPFFPVTSWDQVYHHPKAWRRYLGILQHNRLVSRLMLRHFRRTNVRYDIVLVPTVVLFHWIAWRWLVFKCAEKWFDRVVLTTRNNAGEYDADSRSYRFQGSAKILRRILKTFSKPIEKGVVQFASDSHKLASQYEQLCGLAVTTYPHPRDNLSFPEREQRQEKLTFTVLGPPRYEKGSDLVVQAIESILQSPDGFVGKFIIHWTEPVYLPSGEKVDLPAGWNEHPDIEIIRGRLSSEAYEQYLQKSDVMLLPYRRAQYHARLSGIAIEAFQAGASCICISDTWVEECMNQVGSGLALNTETAGELADAIKGYNLPQPSAERVQMALRTHSSTSFVEKLQELNLPDS